MHPHDSWNSGDHYELYVGRWSRRVAPEFLAWLDLPPSLRWLEVGCGTGALTAAIAARARPAQLTGVDPSEGFLSTARERLASSATFRVANAVDLPFQDATMDIVVSGLVLNFYIDVVPIDIATPFTSFDDYWHPFLGGQGPAPAYAMSLDETSRNRLRDRIRDRLPLQSHGSIDLVARA